MKFNYNLTTQMKIIMMSTGENNLISHEVAVKLLYIIGNIPYPVKLVLENKEATLSIIGSEELEDISLSFVVDSDKACINVGNTATICDFNNIDDYNFVIVRMVEEIYKITKDETVLGYLLKDAPAPLMKEDKVDDFRNSEFTQACWDYLKAIDDREPYLPNRVERIGGRISLHYDRGYITLYPLSGRVDIDYNNREFPTAEYIFENGADLFNYMETLLDKVLSKK